MAKDNEKIEEEIIEEVEGVEKEVEDLEEETTPEASPSVVRQAELLIQLKKSIDEDLLKMTAMKSDIKPATRLSPVRTPSGTVSFVNGSISKGLDKSLVRQVLMDQLRISAESANKIIDSGSIDKIIASYVKVTPE